MKDNPRSTTQDDLFKEKNPFGPNGFVFDARVSEVFDDMVNRSVPGYATIQLLVADMAIRFATEAPIYDLGCSTGNTLLSILKRSEEKKLKLVGIDNSSEILKVCKAKIQANTNKKGHTVALEKQDLLDIKEFPHGKASVIILNLVLQFILPEERGKLIQKLYDGLNPGGCLILVEKTIQKDNSFNDLFIDYYHQYKKEMGYSDMEIAQKREALENVLVPFDEKTNLKMLQESGFSLTTTFFQWMNFQGYLGIKNMP